MLGKHPHLCPVNTLREGHIKVDLGTFLVSMTVVKIPCSQCRGCRFDPWSGTKIPHAT